MQMSLGPEKETRLVPMAELRCKTSRLSDQLGLWLHGVGSVEAHSHSHTAFVSSAGIYNLSCAPQFPTDGLKVDSRTFLWWIWVGRLKPCRKGHVAPRCFLEVPSFPRECVSL